MLLLSAVSDLELCQSAGQSSLELLVFRNSGPSETLLLKSEGLDPASRYLCFVPSEYDFGTDAEDWLREKTLKILKRESFALPAPLALDLDLGIVVLGK